MGRRINSAACMGMLMRKKIGNIKIEDSFYLETLNEMSMQDRIDCLLKIEDVLGNYQCVSSNERGDHFILNGCFLYQWNAKEDFEQFKNQQILKIYDSVRHWSISTRLSGRVCQTIKIIDVRIYICNIIRTMMEL